MSAFKNLVNVRSVEKLLWVNHGTEKKLKLNESGGYSDGLTSLKNGWNTLAHYRKEDWHTLKIAHFCRTFSDVVLFSLSVREYILQINQTTCSQKHFFLRNNDDGRATYRAKILRPAKWQLFELTGIWKDRLTKRLPYPTSPSCTFLIRWCPDLQPMRKINPFKTFHGFFLFFFHFVRKRLLLRLARGLSNRAKTSWWIAPTAKWQVYLGQSLNGGNFCAKFPKNWVLKN